MLNLEYEQRLDPTSVAWIDDLEQLVQRYAHLNVAGDLPAMSLAEMWGLYLYLRRLAQVSGDDANAAA